jgi:DNA helicase MCM8
MESTDPGRVPRTIEVELSEDNVDSCVPGDVVTICGQVKVAGKFFNKLEKSFINFIKIYFFINLFIFLQKSFMEFLDLGNFVFW